MIAWRSKPDRGTDPSYYDSSEAECGRTAPFLSAYRDRQIHQSGCFSRRGGSPRTQRHRGAYHQSRPNRGGLLQASQQTWFGTLPRGAAGGPTSRSIPGGNSRLCPHESGGESHDPLPGGTGLRTNHSARFRFPPSRSALRCERITLAARNRLEPWDIIGSVTGSPPGAVPLIDDL